MGFRINTNVAALNAKANSDLNSKSLDQSLARLSSGLRINSAADDASGMAIADSLRSQASTLGQAISNGNDALGILQTADKAMDEQLKILDTIKTKATQAAQDGQSAKTRTMLQADINRLMEELDNIANTTSFNGKQLLSGGFTNQEFQIGSQSNQSVKASIGATQSSKIGVTRFETGSKITASGVAALTIKNYNGIDDFKFQGVVISTSVGTGLGALAEEINRNSDKTGVRASFNVQTVGAFSIQGGSTSDDFSINGVKIGKVDYKDGDENGSLLAAINAVKDTTGVEASKDENGRLVLTSREGRGIKITGNIGSASGITTDMYENYGRLSLVKNDGRDIAISGTGVSFTGFGDGMVSEASVSLRESKGQISASIADAMGFNADKGGKVLANLANVKLSEFANTAATGWSAQGFAITDAKAVVNTTTGQVLNNSLAKQQTAGVTTLKGAMAVMDIAETAITNLDQIRADIGSVQNQVTSTINNITVTQVNVKSAESQIRDVDFASESANYSKANILAQSGSYAMAQANSSQQNVLRLLQ
ncbi:flagellin [Campylobacter jejuni]|uniref:flagellin n=1 Tax=Campylobacter jejuni TaxID=197 RepID=UPI000F811850|nr:flagellin [Campylobacter jejuni]RTJ77234.1 flagellin [Campylobacter jejuni]RTJ86880.1 flagellin [Campylobacter jejuni]RTJ93103.1 flagellin [Campylobacter jejuni]